MKLLLMVVCALIVPLIVAKLVAAEQMSNKSAARFLTKYKEVDGIEKHITEKKIRRLKRSPKKMYRQSSMAWQLTRFVSTEKG